MRKPSAEAAAVTLRACASDVVLLGLISMPIRIAAGTSSRSNPSCFAPSSTSRNVTPVALPPGRAKLLTSPSSWVIGDTEYEWDRGGGCLGRQRRRGPTGGDNDCHLPAHEVCRHDGQA